LIHNVYNGLPLWQLLYADEIRWVGRSLGATDARGEWVSKCPG
jgi:hypothetical protein